MQHEEFEDDDRDLDFITIRRRQLTYSELIDNYVESIMDLKKKQNFKSEVTCLIEMLVDEIGDMVEEDLLFALIKRSADTLNKKHVVWDD